MTPYRHTFIDGTAVPLPVGKVVCVGRNYAAHVAELRNRLEKEPVLFMKPADALVAIDQPVGLPRGLGACHHEVEIAVLIGEPLAAGVSPAVAAAAVAGFAVCLDLTLRDVQEGLKKKGLPWERAKAFAGSCPMSPILPRRVVADWRSIGFSLQVNGEPRQRGDSGLMIHSIVDLIVHVAGCFTLKPGDLLLTGTPAGVAPLAVGDRLVLTIGEDHRFETVVK